MKNLRCDQDPMALSGLRLGYCCSNLHEEVKEIGLVFFGTELLSRIIKKCALGIVELL